MLRYCSVPSTASGSYVFMDAAEPDELGSGRRRTPLVPRHSGVVASHRRSASLRRNAHGQEDASMAVNQAARNGNCSAYA
jgi:hypothetical protein